MTFYVGELEVDSVIQAAGHEPNGYFWEGVAQLLAPSLMPRLELDSEGSMFCAVDAVTDLEQLRGVMQPMLTDPEAMDALMRTAETQGYEFDD